jgi:hypothetical protein
MDATRFFVIPTARWILSAVTLGAFSLYTAETPPAGAPAAQVAPAGQAETAFDAKAEAVLKAMSEFLRAQPRLVVACERVAEGVTYDNEKVQLVSQITVQTERPGKFRADAELASRRLIWCAVNGRAIGVCEPDKRATETKGLEPATIDGMVDAIASRYGISMPLADLFVADPLSSFKAHAVSGRHVGQARIGGVLCDHLAYRAEKLDWQLWVEVGKTPLPRRFVITYSADAMAPQLTFSDLRWTFPASLPDATFVVDLPAGATLLGMKEFYDYLHTPDEP